MEGFNSYSGIQERTASVRGRPTGKRYNGLKNQGATCYLNSILQCLYMTEDFRREVENFRPDPQNSDEKCTDLMLELQKLFNKIKEVDGTTEGITRSLCIHNVYEQQDAVEYYQKTLKATGPRVSKVFEGKMSNKTKCPNNHIFQENCHFFTIPLAVEAGHSEVFNVENGLQTFFKLLKLDEDDWLYCKQCGQKTETETWNEIEEFPTILTLYLKRFYFDYNQMRLVKNHCPMDIPEKLQISNIGYELYAVINHFGGESGGHYNAVIKSFENNKWYCFDDSFVTKDSVDSFHHSQLAYMLMYRKVNGSHPDEKSTNELQLHCQEYCNLVTMLLQWIRHYVSVFEESKFPTSYKEIETLCHEFLEFKKTQLPSKEADTNHSKHIYKAFEGAVRAGQITVPPGYNPIDVEEEWRQLHEAIIKWERLVRNEFKRVYCFHEHLVNSRNEYNLHAMSDITVSVNRVPLTHPELDEVMLYYIQDLLAWVEKNQRRIHNSEWGADLPSIESHMGSHHRLHESIKDFKSNIERAWADENHLSPASKQAYRDYLIKLDLQYNELLSFSVDQLHNLNMLYAFAVACTEELKWLCERKEEELKYDWSDNNTNMTAKKDNYSGLEWDLEQRKISMNTVLATGDKLLKEGHPAQSTIEALIAALQSQWNWLQQLCCCIQTHIKENTGYFQFFADVKEAEEKMKKIQETMKKKYRFDRSTTVTHLEHLLKDAEEEMEQLIVFKTHLSSLNRRAKDIVQLKPRNPANPAKDKLLIQAVCDCKQREITVHRGDKCELLNNSQPFKWKVKSLNGSKATVPSICFIIPPPNKEAVESSSGLAASLQELIILSKELHMDMTSLLYWQYFMRDMQRINSWNRIMTQEYHEAMKSLKRHYHIFMSNSQDSEFFGADELEQAESTYNNAAQDYKNLLQSKEQGEQDESMCKSYITQIKDIRLRLESYESHMVSCIRQPVDKEPLKACTQGTTEQKKVRTELKGIKKEIDAVVKQSEAALASSQRSPWAPILSSEIDITLKKMEHVYRLSSDYRDKVKSVDLEIHSPQGTEDVLRKYENQLCDVHKVPANEKELETNQAQLKELCCEAKPDKPVEANLRDATVVNMFGVHSNSKGDHYMSFVASLKEGWQAIDGQVELRLQEVDLLGKQLQAYTQRYDRLIQWIADAKQRQEKIQAKPISDKVLKELLAQGKKLLEEIKKNEDKVKECENHAIACMNTLKDHEHQLVKYKASLEPFTSIKVESSSDSIIQEIVTLNACYSEVLTLASQYIKCNTAIQS
ncbi:hypothetical protein PHYPO_G00193430 [Pangasianodon hypophthalmus]|uniref:USP domain-containing protein n=1 Tax=Pangasianodon hypophthalmus TaxID=310915 RepID=A0A5N5PI84_PANHP|nr:hypothetical protein PHYPO_G00193430 [Pangasianodon hypophthalmus]